MSRSVNLLLIDDSPLSACFLRENLEELRNLHCRLNWVQDFESGLIHALGNTHDLYLVDYYLGGRTGADFIRASIQGGCHRPLILYSGQKDVRMAMEAISHGAAGYLVKDRVSSFLLEKTLIWALEQCRSLPKPQQSLVFR